MHVFMYIRLYGYMQMGVAPRHAGDERRTVYAARLKVVNICAQGAARAAVVRLRRAAAVTPRLGGGGGGNRLHHTYIFLDFCLQGQFLHPGWAPHDLALRQDGRGLFLTTMMRRAGSSPG